MEPILYVFGTARGIGPVPGRHHAALALECSGELLWFDAGESCSYTAAMMGVELLNLRGIFISHAHMDHLGGLGELLWNLRREVKRAGIAEPRAVPLYIPEPAAAQAVLQLLSVTDRDFSDRLAVDVRVPRAGQIFSDGVWRVACAEGRHRVSDTGESLSRCYAAEAGGVRVVYTGDIRAIAEIFPLLPCDYLISECSHIRAAESCRALREAGLLPRRGAFFLHLSEAAMRDPAGEERLARAQFPGARLLRDGDRIPLFS